MSAPRRIVLAAPVLRPGFGVATVVRAQARELRRAGHDVLVLGMNVPAGETDALATGPCPLGLESFARAAGASHLVVHGPPYLLSVRPSRPGILVWEHGLVFPEFLQGAPARRAEADLRSRQARDRLFPHLACPSRHLARRLGLPDARVIPNGADHLPTAERAPGSRTVLAVLRTAAVEDQYKGLSDLEELPDHLGTDSGWSLRAVVTGPGSAGIRLRAKGWEVVESPAPGELAREYAGAAVHVAPSRCESFDLPLVEAQRSGAAGIAYRGGAHDETCPHLYSSVAELASVLEEWRQGELPRAQERSREACASFTWENHGRALAALLEEIPPLEPPTRAVRFRAAGARALWSAGSAIYSTARRILR